MSADLSLPTLPAHERALIAGAMVVDSYSLVTGMIASGDFSDPRHRLIWSAIEACAAADRPMDMINVRQKLSDRGQLDAAGGDEYLLDLWENAAGPGNAEKYARDIAIRATMRRFVGVLRQCTANAYVGDVDPATYLADCERAILEAAGDNRASDGPQHISHFVGEMAREMAAHAKNQKSGVTGLTTGIAALDRWTTGMHPGEVIIVAGRSGMGKSAFMTAMMLGADRAITNRATNEREGVIVVFSMEMQGAMVAARAVAGDAMIDLKSMRSGTQNMNERSEMMRSVERVADMAIYVDESPALSIQDVSARLRKLSRKNKIALVVVDYLQLMNGSTRESRELAIAESSRGLKRLAKEMVCPVVALAQLNREVEKRPDRRPQLSDLRESGSIEQDADVVLMLFRQGYYTALDAKNEASGAKPPMRRGAAFQPVPMVDDGVTDIIVAKQRNGPPGVVKCKFEPHAAMFVNLERDYDDDTF